MINGFEKETAPLSAEELSRVKDVTEALKRADRAEYALTNKHLRVMFPELSDVRIRKIINHIRANGLVQCLVASSKGYYVAESRVEVERYAEGLRNRALAILAISDEVRRQGVERFGGSIQQKLF